MLVALEGALYCPGCPPQFVAGMSSGDGLRRFGVAGDGCVPVGADELAPAAAAGGSALPASNDARDRIAPAGDGEAPIGDCGGLGEPGTLLLG